MTNCIQSIQLSNKTHETLSLVTLSQQPVWLCWSVYAGMRRRTAGYRILPCTRRNSGCAGPLRSSKQPLLWPGMCLDTLSDAAKNRFFCSSAPRSVKLWRNNTRESEIIQIARNSIIRTGEKLQKKQTIKKASEELIPSCFLWILIVCSLWIIQYSICVFRLIIYNIHTKSICNYYLHNHNFFFFAIESSCDVCVMFWTFWPKKLIKCVLFETPPPPNLLHLCCFFSKMWPWSTKPVIRVNFFKLRFIHQWINNLSTDVWFVRTIFGCKKV